VFALTLDEARTVAIAIAAVLVVGAVAAFWLLKSAVQKVTVAALLALLAFAVWSQRVSLQECADKVVASYERLGTDVSITDTDCSFFGVTITVADPRDSAADGR
jgi:Na+-translocating ferredoxin:NAD+ oxidoreductase RnfA subunit